MAVRITAELESKINKLVSTGDFRDAGDVIEQAVALLSEQQKARNVDVLLAQAQRNAEINGTTPVTPELFESIRNRARAAFESGLEIKIDPDVWPSGER